MPVFLVPFTYNRTVTIRIKAEDESEIHDFLDDKADWNPLDDEPELIVADESEQDDYSVVEAEDGIEAVFCIHEGEICEVEE